jgi:hypothetical protein
MGLLTNLNQSHTFAVTPEEMESQEPTICLPNTGSWLVGTPVIIYEGTVLDHFSVTHPLQEYLKMLALAVDLEILTSADVVAMLGGQYMIVAASVGVFPVRNFIAQMICLENLTRAYLDGRYTKYDGYNKRIIAFCLERIHSYLLMKKLKELKLGANATGYQLVLSNDGIVVPSGL